MPIKSLFLIIMVSLGMILWLVAGILKSKQTKLKQCCTNQTQGTVIKYTTWDNNGVHFPVVEYFVDNLRYRQKLKYSWVIYKSSSFHKIETNIESDLKKDNLIINRNSHFYTNPLPKYFPLGSKLEVFYDARNPKKSYVMRLAKNPMIKIFFLVGLLFIIIGVIFFILLP